MQGTREDPVARVSTGSGSAPGRITLRAKAIRGSVNALIGVRDFRRSRRLGPPPDLVPPLSPAAAGAQPRAIPRWAGPGAAIAVKRMNAVTLTAMAPITEKIICQMADGIANCAIPCVAL